MRVLLLLFLSLFAPFHQAHAQRHATDNLAFYPLFNSGELIGCQLAFSVLREDSEFSQGAIVRVNGLIVFYGKHERPGVALRLGATRAGANNFTPVARGYLVRGLRTNAAELGSPFLSDDPSFRVFPFGLGDVTVEALGHSIARGQIEIAYGLEGSIVDARFLVDMRDTEAWLDWSDCLRTVVGPD